MTSYTTLVGRVIGADKDMILMQMHEADSATIARLSIPRRVCRNGDQIKVDDTEVRVATSWLERQEGPCKPS